MSRWNHRSHVLPNRPRLCSPHGGGDRRRFPSPAARNDVDASAEWYHRLHHGHHVRILHRRSGLRYHAELLLRIHRHFLHGDWKQSWLDGHGGSDHSDVPVQHHQQRGDGVSADVCIRKRSWHAVQYLPLSVRTTNISPYGIQLTSTLASGPAGTSPSTPSVSPSSSPAFFPSSTSVAPSHSTPSSPSQSARSSAPTSSQSRALRCVRSVEILSRTLAGVSAAQASHVTSSQYCSYCWYTSSLSSR